MQIPTEEIITALEGALKKESARLKKNGIHPHLTTVLVGRSAEQLSYVTIKQKTAKRIGITYNLKHYKRTPMFLSFAKDLKTLSADPAVTGMIIQQPLPPQLNTNSVYRYIPIEKEIEGHKNKSPFYPPLGLAVLTVLKYLFSGRVITPKLLIEPEVDCKFFRTIFKQKRIVLIGRGQTGGKPIGDTLTRFKINYININSTTANPEQYYKEADIIISAVGKKIITPELIKPGVILINAGLRKTKGKLKGDYNESEIRDSASFFTPTPGGIGPLDVIYLFKNLIDAGNLQLETDE